MSTHRRHFDIVNTIMMIPYRNLFVLHALKPNILNSIIYLHFDLTVYKTKTNDEK